MSSRDRPGIVLQNLLKRPALREKSNEKLHRQPRTRDDGLAEENVGIDADSIVPVHGTGIIAGRRKRTRGLHAHSLAVEHPT